MRRPPRELTPSPSAFRVTDLPCSRADVVGTAALHIVLQCWRHLPVSSHVSMSCAAEAHSRSDSGCPSGLGPLLAQSVLPPRADSALWLAPMAYAVAVGLDDDFRFGACALPAPTTGDLQRCVLPVPPVSSHVFNELLRRSTFVPSVSSHAVNELPSASTSTWGCIHISHPSPCVLNAPRQVSR